MDGLTKCSNDESTSCEASKKRMVPKEEVLDYELPSETMLNRRVGDYIAGSSGSNARSFFIGMGFLPSCVDEAIEENGEDNVDLLLETLITYSAVPKPISNSSDSGKAIHCMNRSTTPTQPAAVIHPKQVLQRSNSDSADSLDSLFDDKGPDVLQDFSIYNPPKDEPDEFDAVDNDKRSSLLSMKFTVDEVEFAIDKLGEDAPLNELVDFIIAAQIAGKLEKEDDTIYVYEEKKEDVNNETLFGTMDKTLRLLEMGFTENDVSLAIERFGSDIAISELAASIVEGRIAGDFVENKEFISKIFSGSSSHSVNGYSPFGTTEVKTEDFSSDAVYQQVNKDETIKGKRPKQESMDDHSNGVFRFVRNHEDSMPKEEYMDEISGSLYHFGENQKGKRPKPDHAINRTILPDPAWQEEKFEASKLGMPMPKPPKLNLSKRVDKIIAKPPFFFYGNMHNISKDSWAKISQFMYCLEPEFANTQYFSALNRKEGYVHNLPTENRSHVFPKSAMTIQDVIPQTKKWWPSWDMRKQLNCISSETTGISQLCDKLGKLLTDCQGYPSAEQQGNILCHCRTLNLVWTGKNKLSPIEPRHLECILGYPIDHTQVGESGLMERLQLLKYSFQTDTLGYYLSVLKSIFPEGLMVLSVFSGIGGAEVALHRLGIPMKGLVSVETSQMKGRILRKWWHKTEQPGELVQIEDVQKLTSSKIEGLIKKFGGFDLVICQNSCFNKTSSKPVVGDESVSGFEFSIFYEFVRVMQRVRSMMGRKK